MVTLFVAGSILAGAQGRDSPPPTIDAFPQALGVFTGPVAGWGFSYHRWLGSGVGLQLGGGVMYSPDADSGLFWGKYLDYSAGIEVQQSIFGDDLVSWPWLATRIYLWGGASHRGLIEEIELLPGIWDGDGNVVQEAEYGPGPYTPTVTLGAGFGVEVVLFRHFSFPVEFGYAATYDVSAGSILAGLSVDLVPQAGARYRY